jgi:hypothetical protein
MADTKGRSERVSRELKGLLTSYESLYREANMTFMSERAASGTLDGLEDFYRLVNIIRRNRDVAGSLVRGLRSLRAMDKFRFVEEEETTPAAKKESDIDTQALERISIPEPEPETEPEPAPEDTNE